MSNSEDSQQYLNDMLVKEEDEASGDDSDKQDGGIMLREQDRFLPICNIIKIMKVRSEAIERSVAENRKTVNGDDLLVAFSNLGFDNYVEPLSIYLQKYRESNKSDRNLFLDASYPHNEDGTSANDAGKQ
ncbi:GD24231 [Drosophila simulans]|uniref:GD24231 n=1 Tax=Drosophila simulans TaxID=7240 RepID=B4QA22_DROSI|nr:GD24231 [Drosophila simulans]